MRTYEVKLGEWVNFDRTAKHVLTIMLAERFRNVPSTPTTVVEVILPSACSTSDRVELIESRRYVPTSRNTSVRRQSTGSERHRTSYLVHHLHETSGVWN